MTDEQKFMDSMREIVKGMAKASIKGESTITTVINAFPDARVAVTIYPSSGEAHEMAVAEAAQRLIP